MSRSAIALVRPRSPSLTRIACVLLALVFAVMLVPALGPGATAAAASSVSFRVSRGMNVYPFLWQTTTFDKDHFVDGGYRPVESYFPLSEFDRIKGMGVDHVRLPINVGPLVTAKGDELAQRADYVFRQVDAITAKGLKVIVDIHTPDKDRGYIYDATSLITRPAMLDSFKAVITAMAQRVAARPADQVALELMNEPQVDCQTPGLWEGYQRDFVTLARRSAPHHTLILTGSCGGNLFGLLRLNPSNVQDPNTLYSLHYYWPSDFIFQGYAPTTQDLSAKYRPRFSWPATEAARRRSIEDFQATIAAASNTPERWIYALKQYKRINAYYKSGYNAQNVSKDFQSALQWADRYGIAHDRLYLGEFGAPRPAPGLPADYNTGRLAWLETVRQQAEQKGIPWAYWCYRDYFGLFDVKTGALDLPMLRALGLQEG